VENLFWMVVPFALGPGFLFGLEAAAGRLPSGPAPRTLSPGRRRLFIVLVLAVLAVGQELACRWLFPLPEVDGFNRIHYTRLDLFGPGLTQARRRGLSNVKIRWESEPDGFAFDHTLNLYGFRGPDFAVAPSANRPRVLFIGDSFVEGCGAADGDTLPEQFARAVRAEHPVEAINLGVAAANFPECARLLRDGVRLLRPAAVFLVVCGNDLPAPPPPDEPPPDFSRRSPWVPRAAQLLLRWRAGQTVPRRWPGGPFPFFAPVPSRTNPLTSQKAPDDIDLAVLDAMRRGHANPWNAGALALYDFELRFDFREGGGAGDYLRRMEEQCRDHGARLAVVYVPYPGATSAAYLAAQKRLGGFEPDAGRTLDGEACRSQQRHLGLVTSELGLPFLDLTDTFIEAEKDGRRLFWPIDGHCNAAGYGLMAEVCARYWSTGALQAPAP
jgi:GDSL-like Lipase/Acylhydrolase family